MDKTHPSSRTTRNGYHPNERRIERLEERYERLEAEHRELERKHRDLKWKFQDLKTHLIVFAIMAVGTGVVLGIALLIP